MTGWAYRHLRSFRAKNGFPYSAYVWVYSRIYRAHMRVIHRFGRHHFIGLMPETRRCSWCGYRRA